MDFILSLRNSNRMTDILDKKQQQQPNWQLNKSNAKTKATDSLCVHGNNCYVNV